MARLVFLGKLADLAGRANYDAWSSSGELDWADVLAILEDHLNSALADAVTESRVRVALNGAVLADKAALVLQNGDELAFLPPVSGG